MASTGTHGHVFEWHNSRVAMQSTLQCCPLCYASFVANISRLDLTRNYLSQGGEKDVDVGGGGGGSNSGRGGRRS